MSESSSSRYSSLGLGLKERKKEISIRNNPQDKDKDKVKENVTNPLNDDSCIFIPSECSPRPINNSLYLQKGKSAL